MARTLDANLQTAQDGQTHRPIVEIISQQRVADIPFDGSFLTSETFDEYGINLIPHSTGRLVLAYIYQSGTTSGIKFVYTDTDRTVFATVDLPLYTYTLSEIKAVTICELTGGNIGMVLLVDDKSSHLYRLTRRIYTVTGTAVSNAEIANWSHDTYTSDPWVQTIGTDSYLVVYGKADGSNYYIYKRTSSDFASWSAESALSIGGLTSTWRLANPSIIEISTGDLWLWFDALEATGPNGEELTNIYYSVSSDGGTTWGAAVKVTNYTTYSAVGGHPVAVQKAANQMHLLYTRKVGALHMDDGTTGWPTGDNPGHMHFDPATRKLYYTACYGGGGTKKLYCVVKIDVDTWTVDKYWDSTTTPAFNSVLTDGATFHVWPGHGAGQENLVPVYGFQVDNLGIIQLLDCDADTITTYALANYAPAGISQNVTHSIPTYAATIRQVQIDKANNRMYVLWTTGTTSETTLGCGYIDLTEAGPSYTLATVFNYATGLDYLYGNTIDTKDSHIRVYPDDDLVIFSAGSDGLSSYRGFTAIFILSTGALYKLYTDAAYGDYPIFGINCGIYYQGKFWGGFPYTALFGDDAKRGLCEIDLATDNITFHRPTTLSVDDYKFLGQHGICVGEENQLIIASWGYGVFVFNTVTREWQQFTNSNVAGLTPDGEDVFIMVAYDADKEFIFGGAGWNYAGTAWQGLVMFSVHGFMRQGYYAIGTDPGGGWSFSTPMQLVQGFLDYDPAAAVEPGSSTSMYVFWNSETSDGEISVKWDKDGSSLDLSAFLVDEVAAHRSIDGNPASLAFSVSHGHLFDPYNISSLYSIMLKKGRMLTLRFGERVGGTDYWENQGTFFVTGTTLSFRRGEYPVMEVQAEDMRCLWAHSHVYATAIFNNLPDYIIRSILKNHAGLTEAEMNIPAFEGGTAISHQWIETTIDEILTQICNRFAYFFRFDMDGKASARRISNSAAVDHAYTDNTKLIEYTPDDKYSDFTNRITVQGQELNFTEVTFEEERITIVSGTVGWWGCRKEHEVWYSDDRSRRCEHPRMNVIETATSIPFQLAGNLSERLEEGSIVGLEDRYCVVIVDAPNLIGALAVAIGLVGTGLALGDWAPPTGGMTIPVGKVIEKAGLIMALMILGSTANYQIEVWAQPKGEVQRSVQGQWNDTEHQTEINAVVEQVIQDPLCYSVADCAAVAAFEGMVAQMQRKRVRITKVAHLQDEEGDTIRVVHPYGGHNIELFVTSISRRFQKATPGNNDGYFLDEIEGWVVSG